MTSEELIAKWQATETLDELRELIIAHDAEVERRARLEGKIEQHEKNCGLCKILIATNSTQRLTDCYPRRDLEAERAALTQPVPVEHRETVCVPHKVNCCEICFSWPPVPATACLERRCYADNDGNCGWDLCPLRKSQVPATEESK